MAGSTFPSYPGWNTVRKIGSGSYGAVYEIERDLLGSKEKAALKVISIPRSESEIEELYNNGMDKASITEHYKMVLAEIVREYQLMADIKGHTNIVYCDDIRYIQKDDGIGWDIFIRMELLTPLVKAIDNKVSEQEVVKLGKDICRALIVCNSRKILHRDIKPQNIFVSDDGDYKLGDFGVAKTAERTSGGTKIGTYNYMAPEVFNNQPYGHSSDVYSLGLVMYWMLNERHMPFYPPSPVVPSAAEMDEARRRRFEGEEIPAPLHGSAALKRIVLKACSFDVSKRYSSAEDLLQDLDSLSACPPPTGRPQKRPRISSVILCLIAVLAVVGGIAYYRRNRARGEENAAPYEAGFLDRSDSSPLSGSGPSPAAAAPDAEQAGNAESPAWENAFQALIEDGLINGSGADDYDNALYTYSLYDVDKDGVPELFLHFGASTAGAHGKAYRFADGQTVLIHEFAYGGNYLASYPDGNGVLVYHARMNSYTVMLWTLSDNTIKESELLYTESLEGSLPQYQEIGEVVSGSVDLTSFPAEDLSPLFCYGSWANALDPAAPTETSEPRFPHDDPEFFRKVIGGEGTLIPGLVSREENRYLDRDKIDFHEMSFSEAEAALIATSRRSRSVPDGESAFRDFSAVNADLNGDGQYETVCSFTRQLDTDDTLQLTIVLREQEGVVYAYGLVDTAVTDVDKGGTLYYYNEDRFHLIDEYAFRLCFDGESCFLVRVPLERYTGPRLRGAASSPGSGGADEQNAESVLPSKADALFLKCLEEHPEYVSAVRLDINRDGRDELLVSEEDRFPTRIVLYALSEDGERLLSWRLFSRFGDYQYDAEAQRLVVHSSGTGLLEFCAVGLGGEGLSVQHVGKNCSHSELGDRYYIFTETISDGDGQSVSYSYGETQRSDGLQEPDLEILTKHAVTEEEYQRWEDYYLSLPQISFEIVERSAAPEQPVSPSPSDLPRVTKNPGSETVEVNGKCQFITRYENAELAEWHFVSPDGLRDLDYVQMQEEFPTLTIRYGYSKDLTLENIPKALNGWKVYCQFSNDAGTVVTDTALITVK